MICCDYDSDDSEYNDTMPTYSDTNIESWYFRKKLSCTWHSWSKPSMSWNIASHCKNVTCTVDENVRRASDGLLPLLVRYCLVAPLMAPQLVWPRMRISFVFNAPMQNLRRFLKTELEKVEICQICQICASVRNEFWSHLSTHHSSTGVSTEDPTQENLRHCPLSVRLSAQESKQFLRFLYMSSFSCSVLQFCDRMPGYLERWPTASVFSSKEIAIKIAMENLCQKHLFWNHQGVLVIDRTLRRRLTPIWWTTAQGTGVAGIPEHKQVLSSSRTQKCLEKHSPHEIFQHGTIWNPREAPFEQIITPNLSLRDWIWNQTSKGRSAGSQGRDHGEANNIKQHQTTTHRIAAQRRTSEHLFPSFLTVAHLLPWLSRQGIENQFQRNSRVSATQDLVLSAIFSIFPAKKLL